MKKQDEEESVRITIKSATEIFDAPFKQLLDLLAIGEVKLEHMRKLSGEWYIVEVDNGEYDEPSRFDPDQIKYPVHRYSHTTLGGAIAKAHEKLCK